VRLLILAACAAAGSCAGMPAATTEQVAAVSEPARLVFVGDVMLGRNVAPVVASDPASVFERLRPAVVAADLAFANLESPLTDRPHVTGEHALEADPAAAALLAGAGFDVVGLANNHATDAGPDTVLDSLTALDAAGLVGVGAGADADEATAPLVAEVGDVRVGVLAFDMSGGTAATPTAPGVARWDVDAAGAAVRRLRDDVDVVVVGLHGGIEYLTRPDPVLAHATELLVGWGTDVVWGHGAHVPYPVEVVDGPARPAVVAPGLGNALFDQRWPRTRAGAVLEVLVDRGGVIAMRTGRSVIDAGRVWFDGWDDPLGDAVALDAEWWTPVRGERADVDRGPTVGSGPDPLPAAYETVASATGDVTGTGEIDLVVSYRRPITPERTHALLAEVDWADDAGRSAHLAVYTADGRLRWGSALMPQPVGSVAVCDGSLALAFTTLDADAIVAGGAWSWDGFGFRTAVPLPGRTAAGCTDVDGDGRTEPILTGRRPDPSTDD
jgi:poly-gamma-glutamate capsule biosynthesis protein CapA/YwtB (metallophosphatase superfamily)